MIKKPFIIAEIGLNHNGSFELAKKSEEAAAEVGVSAVKFQNFITEDFVQDKKITHEYKFKNRVVKQSLYQICKNAEYKEEWTEKLVKICKKKKIEFISTPTSFSGVDHLKKHKLKFIKNGSDFLPHLELIKYMAIKNFQIILSTGMAELADITAAVNIIKKNSKKDPIILHCVSQYPTENRYVNLKRISSIKKEFKTICGFSDHTEGFEAAIQALSYGSLIFEKHFTLNKKLKGPDHFFSLNPAEMKNYVKKIKEGFIRLGSEKIEPALIEKKFRNKVRLGLMFNKDLIKGQKLTYKDYVLQKNCPGILPREVKNYIGKKVIKGVKKGTVIKKNIF